MPTRPPSTSDALLAIDIACACGDLLYLDDVAVDFPTLPIIMAHRRFPDQMNFYDPL